jgi:pimeloyl-ACP methyl ester carboxylesterase
VGAGFSFDWGLVQSQVAKFTQVCSYDHSGIGWSDDGPKDSCALRANEVHTALKNAGIQGPYVVVGHSLGALVARLYAGKYPDEIAGIVVVADTCGGLTATSHEFALRRMEQAGARLTSWIQVLLEFQRDWTRHETYEGARAVVVANGGGYGMGLAYAREMIHPT